MARTAPSTKGTDVVAGSCLGGRWLRVSAHPVRGGGGAAFIVSDVTARHRLDEELRRRAEELAEADRRKDEFLAMLAHELRNPLGAIRFALHLLEQEGGSPA